MGRSSHLGSQYHLAEQLRQHSHMNKKKLFEHDAPQANDLLDANRIIQELWNKLREYEDRLAMSSRNSSKSPSSDSPAAKAERKKLQRLVSEIREALNLDTRGIDDN